MNGPNTNVQPPQRTASSVLSCTVTSLELKGWQGNGFRPHSGSRVLMRTYTAIWVHRRWLLSSMNGGQEETKREKPLSCPAEVTGTVANEGNAGFYTFR